MYGEIAKQLAGLAVKTAKAAAAEQFKGNQGRKKGHRRRADR